MTDAETDDAHAKMIAFVSATLNAARAMLGDDFVVAVTIYDRTDHEPGSPVNSLTSISDNTVCPACLYAQVAQTIAATAHADDDHSGETKH